MMEDIQLVLYGLSKKRRLDNMKKKFLVLALVGTMVFSLTPAKGNKFVNKTRTYRITTEKDYEKLWQDLGHRNGKIIIEISNGIVTDNKGNGKDDLGYYRGYDKKKFHKGDKVQSVFVYNPDNNYEDDIISRTDTLIKKGSR